MRAPTKWLVYTVLVGLIPIFARFLAWTITKSETVTILTASDLVAFGLVLHISCINEMEHVPPDDWEWRTRQNGISILFITIYGFFLCAALIGGNTIDELWLLVCAVVMTIVSFIIGFSVHTRLIAKAGG